MPQPQTGDTGPGTRPAADPVTAASADFRHRTWALPACLVTAIVLPVVILAALVWVVPRPESGLAAAVHPVGTPVQTGTDTGRVAAAAALTWRGGPAVHAPAWSGLVTEVRARPGDTLITGSPVAVVDGVTRLAVASSTPFYRALSAGDTGADVTMLRRALGALGLGDYGSTAAFDRRLERGVARLCSRLGCDASTAAFDPAWFVYLPATELAVGSVKIPAAQPAPQQGDEIVTSKVTLTGLTVGEPSSESEAGPDMSSGAQARFPESGAGYVFVPDSDSGAAVALGADFTATGPLTGLDALVSANDTSLGGTIRLAKPHDVSVIATTALVTGARGRTCVYPYATDPTTLTGVPVEVVGGEPGLTKVAPIELQQVLANPAELTGLAPCR